MSERQMIIRVKKLKALEVQQKDLENQIEKLKEEIKADMDAKGIEQQQAGDFLVRWTKVVANRFDAMAFQKEHENLYSQYMKQITSRRFTIA